MIMHPETRFCVDSEAQMGGIPMGDLYEYMKLVNLNVDDIFTDIEQGNGRTRTGNLVAEIQCRFDDWYKNEANDMDKARIFYRYLKSLEMEVDYYLKELADFIFTSKYKIDKRNNISGLIANLDNRFPFPEDTDLNLTGDQVLGSHLSNFPKYLKEIKRKFNKYKRNVFVKLDTIMKEEYDLHMVRGQESINALMFNQNQTLSGWNAPGGTYVTSEVTTTVGTTSTIYNSSSGSTTQINVSGDAHITSVNDSSVTVTTGTVTNNVVTNRTNTLSSNSTTFCDPPVYGMLSGPVTGGNVVEISARKGPSKRELKKKEKTLRGIIKKSIKSLTMGVGKKNTSAFIKGDTFSVSGKVFDYKISKGVGDDKIRRYSEKQNNFSIPYTLSLWTKSGNYLAKLCIVFNGCPIMDQVLSVVLHIKSNNEKYIIQNSGFFSVSGLGLKIKNVLIKLADSPEYEKLEDTGILEIIEAHEKELGDEKILDSSDGNTTRVTGFDLGGSGFTSTDTGIIRSTSTDTEQRSREMERARLRQAQRANIERYLRNLLEKEFSRNYDDAVFNFVFRTEVTWDEMNDYYMMDGYNNNQLDYLVKERPVNLAIA